jgi:hypothetical protein
MTDMLPAVLLGVAVIELVDDVPVHPDGSVHVYVVPGDAGTL